MRIVGDHKDPEYMGGRSGYASYVSEEFALSKRVPVEAVSAWQRG